MGGQELTLTDRGIVMKYEDQDKQPWQEKWHRMRAALRVLKEHYEGGKYPGDRQVARDVEDFFEECFHVGDWIWEEEADPAKKEQLKKRVSDFILEDHRALQICEGVANTSKHRTRRNPKRATAWVDSVTHNNETDKADAVIKWQTDRDNGEEDALALAKRCYKSWRTYQQDNGLKTMGDDRSLARKGPTTLKFVVQPLLDDAPDGQWLFHMYLKEGWVSASSEMFDTRELAEQAARTIIDDARRSQLMYELNYSKKFEAHCARIMGHDTREHLAKTEFHPTPDEVAALMRRLYEQCRVTGDGEPTIFS
jgi:hypothetical protein